jgi:PAS domain S-box-containing protein
MAGTAEPRLGIAGASGLLARTAAELAPVWDRMPAAVWLREAGGRLAYANAAAAAILGEPSRFASAEGAEPDCGWTLCDQRGEPLSHEGFPSAIAFLTGLPRRHHTIGIGAPGRQLRWLLVDAVPLLDPADRVYAVLSTAVDVTSLKQAEIALRVSEDRYRRILETMQEGCCILDADSRIVFVNARLCTMLGYSRHELEGRPADDIFGSASDDIADGRRRRRPAREHDVALQRKDGSTLWALVSGSPMLDDEGQPAAMLAMLTDVTERKASEERALAAAAQIEQLTADAIYTVDADRRICSWNRGAEQLFGWTKEEIIGRAVTLIPEEYVERATAAFARIITNGETFIQETARLTKDGRIVPVLGSWSPVPLPNGGTGVLCILKDISQHVAAHNQLQDQARALALLRERERIAMDLHDGVTQSLYGVALSLGALRRRRGGDAAHQEEVLGGAISQLTEIIHGIRDYIFELRTGVAEGTDLEAGLVAKANELATTTGVRPRLTIAEGLRRLNDDTVMHLLYIVHEALSNVARHASASEVSIEAVPRDAGLLLTIADNGRGFDAARRGRRAGDGLRNMRERASRFGASIEVTSALGKGTMVQVRVP